MVLGAHKGDMKKVIINGNRPSPLSIRKVSAHITKKQSFRGSKQHPNIIYAHSPKIIHAKPREFMALVQRLTGKETALGEQSMKEDQVKNEVKVENLWNVSPECFADIPLFTPNSACFLLSSSPGHMFRYSDMLSPSPNKDNFLSTFSEAKKGLL